MTINGLNFQGGAYVNFGNAVLVPTSVSPFSITVTIPSFLLLERGIVPVTVTNASPMGTSERVLFTIN
jgi:hypothetical protein